MLRPTTVSFICQSSTFGFKLNATLFADDILLMPSDKNLEELEKKYKNKSQALIIIWLRKSNLSLNYSKTNDLEQKPRTQIDFGFSI